MKKKYEVRKRLASHLVGIKPSRTLKVGEVLKLDPQDVAKHVEGRHVVRVDAAAKEAPPDFGAIARSTETDILKALCNKHKVGKGGTKTDMVQDLWKAGIDVVAELEALAPKPEEDKKEAEATAGNKTEGGGA